MRPPPCSWRDTRARLKTVIPTVQQHRGADPPGEPGDTTEGPDPAPSSQDTMAPGRGDARRMPGAAGTCAAAQAALCKATAGHRLLVLQLGGSADSPRLREERRRRSAEARDLSTGKEGAAAPDGGCGVPLAPTAGLVEGFRGCPSSVPLIPQGYNTRCWQGCGRHQRAPRSGGSWRGCGCSSSLPWSSSCRICAKPTTSASSSPCRGGAQPCCALGWGARGCPAAREAGEGGVLRSPRPPHAWRKRLSR